MRQRLRACLPMRLLQGARAAVRTRSAPRAALSAATDSLPWYKRPLSLSDSESGWQLAVATWGFIIFVGVPWSYNRTLALTAPDPATRVTRHKDTVQQMVYDLRCARAYAVFCARHVMYFVTTGPRRNSGSQGELKPKRPRQPRSKGRAIDDRLSLSHARGTCLFCQRL